MSGGVTAISLSTATPQADGNSAPAVETPATRPEYIPEKFWKGDVAEATKAMAASYSELEKKQSSGNTEGTGATAEVTPPVAPSTPVSDDPAVVKAIETTLSTAAGSPEAMGTMLGWAKANATEAQKAAFDAALDSGNAGLVALAFAPIKQAYTEAMGSQGTRVVGESVPTTVGVKPFASQHEIVAFVNSKEYKSGDARKHKEYNDRMAVTNW